MPKCRFCGKELGGSNLEVELELDTCISCYVERQKVALDDGKHPDEHKRRAD